MDAHHAIMPMLVVAVMPLASCTQPSVIVSAAHAQSAGDDAPLIGRLRTRDRTVDLTRITITSSGHAHDLARGVASVIADVDTEKVRASPEDRSGTPRF